MSDATARLTQPKIVPKPWGREVWYAHEDRYAGKILEVTRGYALSLQKHERKQETMYLQSGRILYHFAATLGSSYDPSPQGDFRVTSIHPDPWWNYQPKLLAHVPDDRPNALIKIPATPEGITAIEETMTV